MTLEEFRKTLDGAEPDLSLPLRALWWAARGDWDRAHTLANESGTPAGAWVHAHLHRQEGDVSNARYWYGRAARPECTATIEEEWAAIVCEMLEHESNRRDR